MELGLHIAAFSWPDAPASIAPTLGRLARIADEGGMTSLHVMDHFFQLEQYLPADEPMLEGYSALAYAAAVTSRVRLGLLVGGVTYRYPGVLAKTVTTLDVLSGGRAEFGIGAAWYEREHRGLGVPFPPLSERFEQLEETVQICLQMWSDDNGPYEGRYFRLEETLNSPQAITRPHPPILIGGGGERKTLRLVATYADACNIIVSSPEEARHKFDVLRRHCDDVGRDYGAVQRTMLYSGAALLTGDMEGFVREMEAMSAAGVQRVMVMPLGPEPVAMAERVAEVVVPRLADL